MHKILTLRQAPTDRRPMGAIGRPYVRRILVQIDLVNLPGNREITDVLFFAQPLTKLPSQCAIWRDAFASFTSASSEKIMSSSNKRPEKFACFSSEPYFNKLSGFFNLPLGGHTWTY